MPTEKTVVELCIHSVNQTLACRSKMCETSLLFQRIAHLPAWVLQLESNSVARRAFSEVTLSRLSHLNPITACFAMNWQADPITKSPRAIIPYPEPNERNAKKHTFVDDFDESFPPVLSAIKEARLRRLCRETGLDGKPHIHSSFDVSKYTEECENKSIRVCFNIDKFRVCNTLITEVV